MAFFDFLRRRQGADTLIADLAAMLPELDNLNATNRHIESLMAQHSALVKRANNVYQYRDCMINVGLVLTLSAHAAGLRRVKEWGLSCAPELIAFSRLREPTHCVLITRIPGMTEQPPVPWEAWQGPVPEAARQQLMADAEVLFRHHVANAAMLERRAWHLLPTGQVTISDWSALAALPESAEEIIREKMREMCGL